MREVLRRVLWLAPTLLIVTALAFWTISLALGHATHASTPLFINTQPQGVAALAWGAAEAVAFQRTSSDQARGELVRLGGAALPHILPRLDGLPPDGRERVAQALAPLAFRMGISAPEEWSELDAVVFWRSFWDEHFVDFRSSVVARVVQRFTQRASVVRENELRRLDSFALDHLIEQMAQHSDRCWTTPAIPLTRLTTAASRVTAMPWVVHPSSSPRECQRLLATWMGWWAQHRHEFVQLHGVERFLAPILQTRYAYWARESARTRFGHLQNGEIALLALQDRAPTTLLLLLSGWGGSLGTSLMAGSLPVLARRRRGWALAWGVACLAATCAFLGLILPWVTGLERQTAIACAVVFGVCSLLTAVYQRSTVLDLLDRDWMRTYRALGVSPTRQAMWISRTCVGLTLGTLAPQLSTLLSLVFVAEYAWQLDGLGRFTILALSQRDVSWLMLITVTTTLVVALTQIAAEAALQVLDPRRQTMMHAQ